MDETQSNDTQSPPQSITQCPSCGSLLDMEQTVSAGPVAIPALVQSTEQMQASKERPEKAAVMRLPEVKATNIPAPSRFSPIMPGPTRSGASTIILPQQTKSVATPNSIVPDIWDHPRLGGRLTVCVLLYGDHDLLHKRCLTSIITTVPTGRLDLRVAANQVGPETFRLLDTMPVTKVYSDTSSRLKYPAMREMFYDPECPILSRYTAWFDDDSYVRKPDWFAQLGRFILSRPENSSDAMFGQKMYHPLRLGRTDPRKWFKDADWFKDRPFRDLKGVDSPNGNKIHFITGGFWVILTEAIAACDIPDRRLTHYGGDICIGEQLHQNGYRIAMFNENKLLVHTSAAPPRGKSVKGPDGPRIKILPWYE